MQYHYGKLQQFAFSRNKECEIIKQIRRDLYLIRLIERRENGMIKFVRD